jgi:serine/threonine protein kinase
VDDEGVPAIVMEYVPATDLGDLIKKNGPVGPAEAARIGRGMIAALRAAHAAGVFHRDVKPGNVLLAANGRVVLTDFGIAQASGTSTLTRTGELIGSIDFLSPERLTGGAVPGPEADLWALGATLYQALEGRSPFRRDTPIETAYAIAADEVPTARNAGALAPVIAGLLVRDPALRMSAEEAERRLRGPAAEPETAPVHRNDVAKAQPEPAAAPTPAPTRAHTATTAAHTLTPARRRGRAALWLTAAVAVVAVAAGGTYLATRRDGGDASASTSQSQSPSQSPSPTASASASPSIAPVPAGYHLADETDRGYSVPVPDGWTRQADSNGDVDFIDPTKMVDLKVSAMEFAGTSPIQGWKELEPQTRQQVGDTYHRMRMNATRWRDQPAALWEFTWQGKTRTWHAIDLGFGEEGGTAYAIYLSAPDDQWATYKPVFDNAVAGIRLAG